MQAYYPVAVVTLLAALVYFVMAARAAATHSRSEEHTSELQSH